MDRGIYIQLRLGRIRQSGQLPEPPERLLELAGVKGTVCAPIPIPPLSRQPIGGSVPGLAAHPDAAHPFPLVSKGGITIGANPFPAAVVFLFLVLKAAGKQCLNLLFTQASELLQPLDILPGQLRMLQPFPQLFRQLFLWLHASENSRNT